MERVGQTIEKTLLPFQTSRRNSSRYACKHVSDESRRRTATDRPGPAGQDLDGRPNQSAPRGAEARNALIAGSIFNYEFEFIHPFADGNGRLGRLWQSLILTRWNPMFADIPVESLVFEHQDEYYQALQESTRRTDSSPFIAFMLRMILDAVTATAPQLTPMSHPRSVSCFWRFREK